MSRVLLLAIPFASACAYAPGSFSSYPSSFPGARATVGCLDVAATLTGGTLQQGPVVQYAVGNRCDQVTIVDFSAVHARSAAGPSLGPPMVPFDPRRELRPLPMEARSVITEQIEYRHAAPAAGHGLCVDVGGLNGPATSERWLCQEGGPTPASDPNIAMGPGGGR